MVPLRHSCIRHVRYELCGLIRFGWSWFCVDFLRALVGTLVNVEDRCLQQYKSADKLSCDAGAGVRRESALTRLAQS